MTRVFVEHGANTLFIYRFPHCLLQNSTPKSVKESLKGTNTEHNQNPESGEKNQKLQKQQELIETKTINRSITVYHNFFSGKKTLNSKESFFKNIKPIIGQLSLAYEQRNATLSLRYEGVYRFCRRTG